MPFCLLSQLRGRINKNGDTLPYTLFKDKIVLYSDIGFSTAPFSFKYDFNSKVDKLKYRNNIGAILGFGISYKWFALRFGVALPGSIKSVGKNGSTNYYALGVDFSIRKTFYDIDIRSCQGYAIKNANKWNDSLDQLNPHEIRSDVNVVNFSINGWYFHNRNFKMTALRGITGHYEKPVKTWYLKTTFNVFGVGTENESLVPLSLIDPLKTKTASNFFSSLDIGLIPGYAYVNRINNWQFSVLGGLGAVLQAKFYSGKVINRGFLGLAPRFDFRVMGGYTVPNYFVFLVTDFDTKSIRFSDFVYRQSFYSIRIVGGIRFNTKKQEERKVSEL